MPVRDPRDAGEMDTYVLWDDIGHSGSRVSRLRAPPAPADLPGGGGAVGGNILEMPPGTRVAV